MAITIHQQPSAHSAIGSKTVVVASSTNSGNDGFRYVVRAVTGVILDWQDYLIPPNPNGYMVFDLSQIIKPYVKNSVATTLDDSTIKPIHGYADPNIIFSSEAIFNNANLYAGVVYVEYYLLEGYDVDGLFTIDEESETTVLLVIFYNSNLSLQAPLNYSIENLYGYDNGLESLILSDRLPSTSRLEFDAAIGLNGNYIYIPTYENDYGVFCVFKKIKTGGFANKIRLSILPNSGAPVQQILPLSSSEHGFDRVGIYPGNLNASGVTDIIKPQDYPSWKAIYFQILNDAEEIISNTYVMFNADRYGRCLDVFDKVRIAWVGRHGGWEYFNFTKKSEESYVTEKKIAQRVIGNYGEVSGSVPFSFNSFDESEIVTDMQVDKYLTATSDWLSDGEFQFLKGLFLSKQVHWVQDDGTHIPVILEANGYEVKRHFGGGRMYDQTIKLKIAQEQFN